MQLHIVRFGLALIALEIKTEYYFIVHTTKRLGSFHLKRSKLNEFDWGQESSGGSAWLKGGERRTSQVLIQRELKRRYKE